MDNELSVRAGLNIGIEPTLLPFVQAAAGNVFVLDPSKGVVIAEHTDLAARVLGSGGLQNGYAWNSDPAGNVDVFLDFVDELGNTIPAVIGTHLFGLGPSYLAVDQQGNDVFYCLAPGEQIVARFVPQGT
jgi:hypothetical protein